MQNKKIRTLVALMILTVGHYQLPYESCARAAAEFEGSLGSVRARIADTKRRMDEAGLEKDRLLEVAGAHFDSCDECQRLAPSVCSKNEAMYEQVSKATQQQEEWRVKWQEANTEEAQILAKARLEVTATPPEPSKSKKKKQNCNLM